MDIEEIYRKKLTGTFMTTEPRLKLKLNGVPGPGEYIQLSNSIVQAKENPIIIPKE